MIRRTAYAVLTVVVFAATAHAQTTVTLNSSSTLNDVTIRGGTYAATNYEGGLLVTKASTDATYVRRALLTFATPSVIPSGATIRSASLTLTVHAAGSAASRTIGVYPVTRSFTTSQATWDIAKYNVPWTTPGGDLGPLATQGSVSNVAGSKATFNVTALVQAAVNASHNARVALVDIDSLTTASAGYRDYYPVESSTVSQRPTLVVSYTTGTTTTGTVPNFSHVFFIVMENKEYSQIIGNTAAPYINSLAKNYALATNYTAVTHPSLPNYMALTGGKTVFTSDCQGCTTSAANVADQVYTSGRKWKAYMESMPAPCYITDSGTYAQKHNPFVHYTDIVNNSSRCDSHVVPMTSFYTDLANNALPQYVWISPNLCHDMHDCSIGTGDTWLSTLIPKITSSPAYANSAIFLLWDEGTTTTGGGGHVPLIVVSPLVAPGTRSSTAYNHYNLLATLEQAWGMPRLGNAAGKAVMSDLFK